jgi:hypothetical protein
MSGGTRTRIPGLLLLCCAVAPAWSCDGGDGGDAQGDRAEDAAEDGTEDAAEDRAVDADGDVLETGEDRADAPPPAVNGRLETVDGIDVLYLWGTRAEIGYAEGSLMCRRATRLVQDYILDYVVPASGLDYATLLALVSMAYVFPAGDEAELEGMVEGMLDNCPPADLIVESPNLEPAAGGRRQLTLEDAKTAHALADWACSSLTVWGAASRTGRTLHARNLDFYQDDRGVILESHIVKLYSSAEEGGARWLSVAFPGLIGCISCFAENGAGLTIHNSNGLAPSEPRGNVPRMLTARAALAASARAADPVRAAEDVLEAAPQQVGNNFHLSLPCPAEPCAGGAVFEYDGSVTHADGRVTVRQPGEYAGSLATDRAIVCTNHYLKRAEPVTAGSTAERYAVLAAGVNDSLASGGLDAAGALALMDRTAEIGTTPTIHTVIMDTAAMQLQLRVAPSTTVEAPAAAPVVLDFARLFAALP